uniref:Mitochondrial import receptor subunit TOM20 homolog n=1 Tax=Panagrellus redivivus TaxID=6233 RepID=A0A7E4UR45_PANRE
MSESIVDSIANLPWKKIAIASAASFIGYAIYFDYKRTHAPDYQQKIREKRRGGGSGAGASTHTALPDMSNPSAVQGFFLQEVQIGEELMASGNPALLAEGAEHLANAVLFCGQSEQLLAVFQQTFPPEHFQLVLSKLPAAKGRLEAHVLSMTRGSSGDNPSTPSIVPLDDDDLE